ncbi:MAG: TonB-dependent receptor [Tenuifilaceae bacterium]|nr:TonB-dependent receptor [Tenuifilaceae bacterium]
MRILTAILFVFSFQVLYAQNIIVKDKDSNTPLESVTITSTNPVALVVTNGRGQADISLFRGSNQIELRMMGYTTMWYSYKELEQLNFEVLLTPSIFSVDQVVVSASKWSQKAREIPLKISSVSKAQVAFHNPQTAADLLTITGDVFVQKSQQGGGSPMIRGFATNRLLIAVDGVRMNNAIFRSGNLQNVISLDPFAIEQTEVLFGPGSVLYGSDAIGGVMSFYTLSPKYSINGKTLVTGSSSLRYSTANAEKTGHIDVNLGWEKWASVTSFSYNNFGDLRMGSSGPDEYLRNEYVVREGSADVVTQNPNPRVQTPTGYAQANVLQKIAYTPNSNWTFEYGWHYSTTSNFDRYDRLVYYRNGLPRSAQWYYGPQVWMMNNLLISSRAKTIAYDYLKIQLAQQYFKESRHDRAFNKSRLRNRFEEVDAFTFNVDLKKLLSANTKLLYGAEAVANQVNSTGIDRNITTGVETPSASRYPKAQWYSFATYLTYEQKLSDKVIFQAGGRYSHFLIDAQFDNTFYPFPFTQAKISKGSVSGSVGLTINPSYYWSINTILSTGFRAPNVDDMGKVFDSEPGSVVVPNPNLNAEYAYNAEVGITRRVGDFFEIDFLTYFTLLDNAMVRRNTTLNGQDSIMYDGQLSQVQSIQNAAFAKVWGIQADFELMIPGGFMISSRFNYQKGTEELDNGTVSPLRHAAPWFGVVKLDYKIKKIQLSLFSNYSGEVSYSEMAEGEREKTYIYAVDSDGNPYSPAWYTVNFRALYQVNNMLSFTANIENLTDQRYRPYSSGLVAAGINFIAGVRVNF